jgi:hypothetical protein
MSKILSAMGAYLHEAGRRASALTLGLALEMARSSVLLPAFGAPTRPTSASIFNSSSTSTSSPGLPCSALHDEGLCLGSMMSYVHGAKCMVQFPSDMSRVGQPARRTIRALNYALGDRRHAWSVLNLMPHCLDRLGLPVQRSLMILA